jgi:hypothetical protein
VREKEEILKMSGRSAVLLVVVIMVMFACTQAGRLSRGSTGKFQIISGEFIEWDASATPPERRKSTLFRLDTETGETWLFSSSVEKNGTRHELWWPIR